MTKSPSQTFTEISEQTYYMMLDNPVQQRENAYLIADDMSKGRYRMFMKTGNRYYEGDRLVTVKEYVNLLDNISE
jgi:hypothetical protein